MILMVPMVLEAARNIDKVLNKHYYQIAESG
jgi:hypothetical protein